MTTRFQGLALEKVTSFQSEVARLATPRPKAIEATVRMDQVRYEYGFGFGDLYHPYTEVLKARNLREGVALLTEFYSQFGLVIKDFLGAEVLPVQYWRHSVRVVKRRINAREGSGHFAPRAAELKKSAAARAGHLFELANRIEMLGFDTSSADKINGVGVPGGHVLLLGGQHRSAVLNHLGLVDIPIEISGRLHTPTRLSPWNLPLVIGGVMSMSDARKVLNRISEGFSKTEALARGLPFA